ncbi:CCA tRNA nucleotidyltransferase [Caldanaerobius polysaccharolyticus]|uniref:CCA tRNA nucleotidyltransferase n=1 Tax=Caldanaerobius polysaccharolyticus TaxID=44256 RepID=UPI00047C9415|nr:HD domain-containing protein [Caldanaerobius polysaccharolyticus]
MSKTYEIPSFIVDVCRQLKNNGYEAYVVGGALRDIALGKESNDWDIATSALPEEMSRVFRGIIPYGDFGTMLLVKNGVKIEITPYRNDAPGRKPTYKMGGTIYTDLARRDFTVNSMAYDPIDDVFIDPYNGLEDLKKRVIRCTGSTRRIWEDPLRAIRAARFQSQLGFAIENSTYYALVSRRQELSAVSKERIRDEFNKLLMGEHVSQGLYTLVTTGLMEYVIPELMDGMGVEQIGSHVYDVLEHNLMACVLAPPVLHIRLAALLHDVGKPYTIVEGEDGRHFYGHEYKSTEIARKALRRLKYPNDVINKVLLLVKNHMFTYNSQSTLSAARRLIAKLGWDGVYDLIELRKADRMAGGAKVLLGKSLEKLINDLEIIKSQENAFTVKDLKVDGNDLKARLGLKEGPVIGEVLRYLLEIALDYPEKNRYGDLILLAREYLKGKGYWKEGEGD